MNLPLAKNLPVSTVSPSLLAQFYNNLSYLLNGGVSASASLGLCKIEKCPPALERLIEHLEQTLNTGQQLSVAMRSQHTVFGGVAVALIESAERDGTLGAAFSTISELINKEIEYKKSLQTAFAYPAILLLTVLLMLAFVLVVLTPSVKPILLSSEAELGLITRSLFWLASEPLLAFFILGFAPASLIAFYLLANVSLVARKNWDALLLRFWVLGGARRDLQYSRFCNICARLTYSGLDMNQTLAIAIESVDNLTISNELKMVRKHMQIGDPLSRSLDVALTAPFMLAPLISVAESSGNTAAALQRASSQLEQQARWHLYRFTQLAPPLLVCVLGFLILAIVVGLLGPILGAAITMGVAV